MSTGKAQKREKLGSPINTWSSTIKVWRVGLGRRSQKQRQYDEASEGRGDDQEDQESDDEF